MARLIVKSPYYKCGGNATLSGYLRYIATRERVELLPGWPSAHPQAGAAHHKTDQGFPEAKELGEYSDYKDKPTKANASVFITRAQEENWSQVQQSDGYMKYIATRPRAERLVTTGSLVMRRLWNLEQAMQELDQYNRECVDAYSLPEAGGRRTPWI